MNKVKVINFVPGLDSGGVGNLMMEWFKRRDANVEMEIATIGKGLAYDYLKCNGCIIYSFEPLRTVGVIKYYKRAYQIIKNGKYDIVHSHVGVLSVLIFIASIFAGVKKRILHAHGTKYNSDTGRMGNSIILSVLKKASVLLATDYVACSKNAAVYLFGRNIANKKATIIHNGIDLTRFKYVEKNLRSNKIIGYIARFESDKNQVFLIDVLNEVLKIRKDVSLLFVGKGDISSVVEKAEEYGINDWVTIVPPQQEVEKFYHSMDVFAFPSINEGLGIVAIEAQACGIPTITSLGVPEEAIVSSIGFRMELNVTLWTNKILELLEYKIEEDTHQQICDSDYNVIISTEKIMKMYLEK